MKRVFIVMAVLLVALPSCRKFSIVGTWRVTQYFENGADKTTDFNNLYVNYKIKLDGSGNFIETATILGINTTVAGPYELTNGDTKLTLTNQADNSKRYFDILELKNSTAVIRQDNNKEFHLAKI